MTYQSEDPIAFLREQGWPVTRAGRELVTTCPFCDKPAHLYMNAETGVWKCHRCGESGNVYQMRQRLGLGRDRSGIVSMGQAVQAPAKRRIPMGQVEALHRALIADQEAIDYCTTTRRWSVEVVKRFKLGLRVDGRGKWLAYPWLRRGECAGTKYRILPAYQAAFPARFEREPGCESVLFNTDALERHEDVILASGESDALALLTLGYENVVATTTGESSLPASAVDALGKKARVLIPFDTDVAGQKGAREVGKRLGFDRTWLVQLPAGAKDVNDFLVQGGTREAFAELLSGAIQFDVPSVLTLGQALDRLEAEKATAGWDIDADEMTPWATVNRLAGRWRGGNLVVASAPPGTGKTTWCLQVAASWAAKGKPALFYCLEMSVEELVQHVLCAHYGLTEEQITPAVIAKARLDLADWPLYLGGNPRVTKGKELMDLLAQAVRRYGLQLVAFDNLHFLARNVEHRTEEVGALTKGFKSFAMEYEIPVLLIAQPRKLARGQVMTPWDLAESVSIYSDADQILLFHREFLGATNEREAAAAAGSGGAEIMSQLTLIRLAKGRHRGERDGFLYLVGAEHRFREIEQGDVAEPAAARPTPVRRQHPGFRDD